jgi:hypothetical protein
MMVPVRMKIRRSLLAFSRHLSWGFETVGPHRVSTETIFLQPPIPHT